MYKKNQSPLPGTAPLKLGERPEFDLKEVLELVTDAFTGATERHIEVGDGLEMLVVEKGKEMRWITLREFTWSSFPSVPLLLHELNSVSTI